MYTFRVLGYLGTTVVATQWIFNPVICLFAEVESFAFGPNALVTFRQKEQYKRNQLIGQTGARRKRSTNQQQTISISFRTDEKEGLLFYSTNGNDFTTVSVSINDSVTANNILEEIQRWPKAQIKLSMQSHLP